MIMRNNSVLRHQCQRQSVEHVQISENFQNSAISLTQAQSWTLSFQPNLYFSNNEVMLHARVTTNNQLACSRGCPRTTSGKVIIDLQPCARNTPDIQAIALSNNVRHASHASETVAFKSFHLHIGVQIPWLKLSW